MKALGALLLTSTQLGASRSQLLKKGHQEEGEMLHTRVFCPFLEKFFTVIRVSLSASASQLGSCGLCPRDQTLGLIISDSFQTMGGKVLYSCLLTAGLYYEIAEIQTNTPLN